MTTIKKLTFEDYLALEDPRCEGLTELIEGELIELPPERWVSETLRHLIEATVSDAIATSRAEASLCSLSFQSKTHPERHVWLDSENKSIRLDLEDWQDGDQWDNAVARVTVESLDEAVDLVKVWLLGEDMAQYLNLNRDYGVVMRKAAVSN